MNLKKRWLLIFTLLFCGCARKEATPPIYDENADARRDLDAAIVTAEKSNRQVVLIFGANW